MQALLSRDTWDLVYRSAGTNVVGCHWVYTIKYRLDVTVDRTRLVVRGFTQTFGVDYKETFSPIARLNSIHVLLCVAINQSW